MLKKLGYSILVLWGVVSLVFFLFNILPGDPARMIMGQRASEETLQAIRTDLGLDRSAGVRYVNYLNDLSPLSIHSRTDSASLFYLDQMKYPSAMKLLKLGELQLVLKAPYLGRSYQTRQPVAEAIGDVLPTTALLAFVAILFAFLVGTLNGILCALFKDSYYDRFAITLSAVGVALPSFFTAILFGWFFAFVLADITHLNLTGNIFEIDDFGEGRTLVLKNLILPSVTLGIRPLSVITQLTRNSILDVMTQDHIRTARAKGLSQRRIISRHILRNSMNPVLTAVSGWFASLMAGVVFVEYIFGWKGLGYLIVNALNQYDLPLVLGSVLVIASIFVVVNLLVDLMYIWLDPRLR